MSYNQIINKQKIYFLLLSFKKWCPKVLKLPLTVID